MSKTKAQKAEQIEALAEKLTTQKAAVLAEFSGLSMEELTGWRREIRTQGASLQVTKNTLLTKAAEQVGIKNLNVDKVGRQLALATGSDEVTLAKLISKFAKSSGNKVKIYSGLIDKQLTTADVIMQLASLPSREELLAKLVGSMASPISGFVRVLNGPLQGFYNVVKAMQEKSI
ncbi:50S ribosomal protein L10 [Patescibacteria group bacterium]|nr:50S ribosomal protein L10 [Patescibacteria group bacterium]